MESYSKIPLSRATAAAIVARHFDPPIRLERFEELKDGFFNTAALLELSDGRRLVLKAAPPDEVCVLRYERDILRAEVEVLRRVAAETDVPTPRVRVYDTTRSLLPSDFFLMDFLPGESYHKLKSSLSPADQARVENQIGRIAFTLSQVRGPAFGLWAQPCAAGVSWRECFAGMLQAILQDGIEMEVDLKLPYTEIYRRMQRHFGALETVKEPRLVHWDLWDGNIFVDPQSLRVTGVIDFERALWGDPLIEVIFWGATDQSNAARGFGEALLAAPGGRTRRLLYDVYLHLIMVIECYYRHYPTPDQENWIRPILEQELAELA